MVRHSLQPGVHQLHSGPWLCQKGLPFVQACLRASVADALLSSTVALNGRCRRARCTARSLCLDQLDWIFTLSSGSLRRCGVGLYSGWKLCNR